MELETLIGSLESISVLHVWVGWVGHWHPVVDRWLHGHPTTGQERILTVTVSVKTVLPVTQSVTYLWLVARLVDGLLLVRAA